MRSKKWIVNGSATYEAYLRRPTEIGLSVGTTKDSTVGALHNIKWVGRLAVAGIQSVTNPANQVPLEVVLDRPGHGNITNVPIYEEGGTSPEVAAAEFIAGELARQSPLEPAD
jgi:hypothetical protein